jgi:hypothetical protein
MIRLTYRGALLSYGFLFLVLLWPYWLGGDVIAPHRQLAEIAMEDRSGEKQLENRKFSDFSNGYIPRASEQLIGLRSGWLTLWVNKNELGYPAYQISGFTLAYMPTWLVAQITKNPWQGITVIPELTSERRGTEWQPPSLLDAQGRQVQGRGM